MLEAKGREGMVRADIPGPAARRTGEGVRNRLLEDQVFIPL
jgi:hypothetical protein